jgi:hypothetical protein
MREGPTRRDLHHARRLAAALLQHSNAHHPLPLHRHRAPGFRRLPQGTHGGRRAQNPGLRLVYGLLPRGGIQLVLREARRGLRGREALVTEAEPVEGGAQLIERPGVLPGFRSCHVGEGRGRVRVKKVAVAGGGAYPH